MLAWLCTDRMIAGTRLALAVWLTACGAYYVVVQPLWAQVSGETQALLVERVGDLQTRLGRVEDRQRADGLTIAVLQDNMSEAKILWRTVAGGMLLQVVMQWAEYRARRRRGGQADDDHDSGPVPVPRRHRS